MPIAMAIGMMKRSIPRPIRPLRRRSAAGVAASPVAGQEARAVPMPAARPEVRAFVALGANLGDAAATVQRALQSLGDTPGLRLVKASSLYRTAPVDATGPDFINAVAEVVTTLTAPDLLEALQAIEAAEGRERPYRNAPRTLDLDLLLYGDARIDSPRLTVPHPRMFERAFVLVPLAEVAPASVDDRSLQAVRYQPIERV
jgi:2-amino-4-hydroxy-6-hydroxymethyldihydropteridine diphosphokinase